VNNSTTDPAPRHQEIASEPVQAAAQTAPEPVRGRGRRKKVRHQAAKPHGSPLTVHPSGRFCKKIKGKLHYFGKVSDGHQAAIDRWLAEKDFLLAGRQPPRPGDAAALTLEDLCNSFLGSKKLLADANELSPYTLDAYQRACDELMASIGWSTLLTDITPLHLENLRAQWAKRWGPARIAGEVGRTRAILNFAYKNDMIDRPIKYGEFRRPSKKTLRLSRYARGIRMFEADELRRMIAAAGQPLKAMLLLAANCGMGNHDCAALPLQALDLKNGWLDFPRPKTGVNRHVPLWPETIAAINEWLSRRPAPRTAELAQLVFLTHHGRSWAALHDQPIGKATRKLLDWLGINGNRNFYAIRHGFETMAGESRDQPAVDSLMGHDSGSMANVYRERISDARLKAVTDYVHEWLFADQAQDEKTPEATATVQ
jgi:integrase